MKRLTLAVLTTLFLVLGNQNTASAQIEKGNFLIDPYIGAPTMNMWWAMGFDPATGNPVSPVGPPISFGGRFEYMLADNFGVKLDANYRISGFKYQEERYNSNTNAWETAEYKYNSDVLRIMLGFNYHFVQTENLDVYTGFSVGYKDKTRRATWNGIPESIDDIELLFPEIPVTMRFAIGVKYYFHPNIGVFLDAGALGGSPFQLGAAVKF